MSLLAQALEAKSDQLNAVDIMGYEPIIKIRDVQVKSGDQPVSIYFDGDNNKPWKPAKGMLRILAAAWGMEDNGKQWIGKRVQIHFDPTVKWAGKEVGGIRIKALTDIKAAGVNVAIATSKQQRSIVNIPLLKIETVYYPVEQFDKALPKMIETMESGKMTLQQVIAHCQRTGTLTSEQLAKLEAGEPLEINESEEV